MNSSMRNRWALSFLALTALFAGLGWWFWPWSVDKFLGEDDFHGHAVPAGGPVPAGGLQATYTGAMMFTNVDKGLVSQLLPSGFELAPRKTSKLLNKHPVVLLFGDQTDGALVLSATTSQPTGIHYSEAIFAIPFVQKRDASGGWHTYIVRMYLDNAAAVAGGIPYGYQKELRSIEWKGSYARIWSSLGSDVLEGNFAWGAKWYSGSAALQMIPNFRDMVNIMTTEILGHNGILAICSHWEWNLDFARVAKAKTSYDMLQAFRGDMGAWPGLSPFESTSKSAVVVRGIRWRLKSIPHLSCSF